MNILKTIKCFVTRHHWLIQSRTHIDDPNPNMYEYLYECQYCGKESTIRVEKLVVNLTEELKDK